MTKLMAKFGWFTTPSMTNLRNKAYVAPIESSVLAQSGKNKHVSGAGPAKVNNKMADVRVEELSRFK